MVFSASTRWLWWKRTTGLIRTRRLCDFCWDYGRRIFQSIFVVQNPSMRKPRVVVVEKNNHETTILFSTKKEGRRGKGNFDDSVLLAASWIKNVSTKGTQKLLLGCQKDLTFLRKKKSRGRQRRRCSDLKTPMVGGKTTTTPQRREEEEGAMMREEAGGGKTKETTGRRARRGHRKGLWTCKTRSRRSKAAEDTVGNGRAG